MRVVETLYPGRWWKKAKDGRFQCGLCPRQCSLRPGQKGFCFVREASDTGIWLSVYGRASGFCVDPVEKKPLYHFLPGTTALSFGTTGCNLGCKFCQNWRISRSREGGARAFSSILPAGPEAIAWTAQAEGCASVAFTYNDPVVFAEYAIDTARECRKRGIRTIAVTAGYISDEARPEFFSLMDAANVDLKGFSEAFYRRYSLGEMKPVLETLVYLAQETDVWLEITNLLIPGLNDTKKELEDMTVWIASNLGPHVPVHFSAFHPEYKMWEYPATSAATLSRAREIAIGNGLKYVYTGNVADPVGSATFCPNCLEPVIKRDGFRIGSLKLNGGNCTGCGQRIAGHFTGGHELFVPGPKNSRS
ncbi:MAG TPA: AmmeMemoRadiSam system radical SAM enzyme [Bdellovibrionota bacterium]|nr:AmmeMemoRadiSam system radical SAM enzyme [Bdellovibrionota bacterium]